MGSFHRRNNGHPSFLTFCQTLCLCTTWTRVVGAFPQDSINNNTSITPTTASFDLLPITGLIPSASIPSPTRLIPSQTRSFGLIPSQRPTFDPLPSNSIDPEPAGSESPAITSHNPIDHDPSPPTLSPTVPIPQTEPSDPIPSLTITQDFPSFGSSNTLTSSLALSTIVNPTLSSQITTGVFNSSTYVAPSMASTDQPLRPIPAPTSLPDGDPNGHHEISEPNFTATVPCRGCSPVIELSKTGFFDWPSTPIADHEPTPPPPPKATVTAGTSQVIISKEPTGGNWVIGGSTTISSGQTTVVGGTTIAPGQTIIVDNTPIVIRTSSDRADIVIGSSTIAIPQPAQITAPPVLAPVVVGGQTITANPQSQYIVSGQTLAPGGPAITIDGTTLSLLPSATALVVNGATTTLIIPNAAIITTTLAPLITLFSDNQVFTANPAGQYVLAPGTTLVPGGPPVTVSNTVVSLDLRGTAVVVQGSTKSLAPQTTVVTITRAGGWGGYMTPSPRWSNALPKGTLGPLNAGVSLEMTCSGGLLALALVWIGVWL